MNSKHQKAFNKAYTEVIKSKRKSLLLDKKKRRYDVVVPLAVVIESFKVFINTVEKDLKIGKHSPSNKATAKNRR